MDLNSPNQMLHSPFSYGSAIFIYIQYAEQKQKITLTFWVKEHIQKIVYFCFGYHVINF
jgi:hypothetical protein